jgi:hypothetical protein
MSTQPVAVVALPAPKTSIWTAIAHFFKNVEVVVSDVFVKLFGADAAHNFAAAGESLLKTELGKLAWSAVNEAQALAAGTDKRAAAFGNLVAAAKTAGLEVKDSIVNLLIELAVQKVKGSFGPAA